MNTLQLTSPAFAEGQPIPARHTCDGDDLSPHLAWSEIPPRTRSFALIADDPDAPRGPWVHWVLFNVAAATRELPEGMPVTDALPGGARQGLNDFGHNGYNGPCPPPGRRHRYNFRLYALDVLLPLETAATKSDLLHAMKGHVLADVTLMGVYQRRH